MPPVPVVAAVRVAAARCLRAAAVGAAVVVLLAVGGCGDGDGDGSGAGATPATAPAADPAELVPSVTFTFGPGGLEPARARVAVGPDRVLSVALASADGRPHGATITVAGRRTRLVASPGQTAARLLQGVTAGRYRLVPDGATEPVTLVVTD